MSLLDRLHPSSTSASTGASGRGGDDGPTSPLLAALTGLWSAALSWLVVVLPALLAWATSAQSTASWGQSVRVASDVWLVLHRVAVQVPDGQVALAPFGGLALPVGLAWLAGRRIGHSLDPRHVTAAGGPLRAVAPLVASLAAGYAVVLVLVALLAHGDGVRPVVWQAVVAGVVLPAGGGLVAALRAVGAPVASTVADALRLPELVRRAGRPAALLVAALVAVGALLVVATLALRFGRVGSLYEALGAGVVGGAVVTLGQLLLVPNLVLWGVAFVSGQGFALGAGTSVTPGGSELGLLPLVPVLGAVPPPGALPVVFQALVAVPVVLGAVAGWWVVARRGGTIWDALAAAGMAAVVLMVLLALSGGAAGPGTLAAVGPSPWKAGLVLAGELALGAGPAAWATHRRRRA
ncbi:MAG: cell division protein PerM [Angustibacter sp.]